VKVLVCGSRDFAPIQAWDCIEARLRQLPRTSYPQHLIISGGARGPDAISHMVAKKLGLRTKTYRAEWAKYGRRAGILRNVAMLDTEPDLVLALWDGESRGTKHTIDEARRRGIAVEVVGVPVAEDQ
jgi:hypothetical protein